jgi:hypothetical protein
VNHRILQKLVKQETYNNYHFDIKLAPKFVDAKLIICFMFPDQPGGLIHVKGFKIWPWRGN